MGDGRVCPLRGERAVTNLVVWGTGIAPAEFSLRRRVTSEGDQRVTSEGDIRVCFVPSAQIVYDRVTSEGDQRVTSAGDDRVVDYGLTGPQYFQTDNVTTDGGEPFEFSNETNPWQPAAQGGECVFEWAYVTLSWSMAATVRLSAYADNDRDPTTLPDGSTLENVRSTFVLDQQSGNLNRVSAVFPVPLVRRIVTDGEEVSRWYLRGERLTITIESTGPLGVGELLLEGIQCDYEVVRKAIYATVDSTP